MERVIVHYDLDCFFVAVERLRDSRLVGKPVMVGGLSDRAVVSACSYETRRFGVHTDAATVANAQAESAQCSSASWTVEHKVL